MIEIILTRHQTNYWEENISSNVYLKMENDDIFIGEIETKEDLINLLKIKRPLSPDGFILRGQDSNKDEIFS